MIPRTTLLMNVTGQTGVLSGNWYDIVQEDGRTHEPITVTISAGTATVVIEARNDPNGAVITLNTLSASDGFLAGRFSQYRARLSAAAAASVQVAVSKPMKQV